MIVIDTNIISELMRTAPHRGVMRWIGAQQRETLYAASVSQAEILAGIALLPAGRRRDDLGAAVQAIFANELAGRILPFDAKCCPHYAHILMTRRKAGRPVASFDALIAATASSFGASIATRNIRDFEGCGPALINPWSES